MAERVGPENKKGRLFGSGTTNEARKTKRASKQWSALEQADPSSPSQKEELPWLLDCRKAQLTPRPEALDLEKSKACLEGFEKPRGSLWALALQPPAPVALPPWIQRGGRKVGGGISLNNFLRSSCFKIELSLPPTSSQFPASMSLHT